VLAWRAHGGGSGQAAWRDPITLGELIRAAGVDVLGAECRRGPVVIVLEDLHWGDVATVKAIEDAALRRSFLEAVPDHARTLALCQERLL
jgi:hypothetical protein